MSAEVEITPGERNLLHPLFVVLRDKRALLDAPHGREDSDYVTSSIQDIREELTTALKTLGPDSPASPWLEVLRKACREYLDAIAQTRARADPATDFAPALGQLRASFWEIAERVADRYDLPSARELAVEMAEADALVLSPDERVSGELVEQNEATIDPPQAQLSPPSTPRPGSEDPLVKALGDRDGMVRFQAMSSLGDHLSPALLPVIEPLLDDRDDDIRRYAVEYYAKLNPPDTSDQLVKALGDRDGMVRFQAMSSLGDHLSPALLPVIEPLLDDRDDDIRRYAVEYYAKLRPR